MPKITVIPTITIITIIALIMKGLIVFDLLEAFYFFPIQKILNIRDIKQQYFTFVKNSIHNKLTKSFMLNDSV